MGNELNRCEMLNRRDLNVLNICNFKKKKEKFKMNVYFFIKVMYNKIIMKSGFYREKYFFLIFGFCLWEGGVCL